MHPGKKLGPFVIEDEIGSGAMGTVYRAKYREKQRRVAIKMMIPSLGSSESAMARFEREAEILKQLIHPSIVRLLAVGKYNNSPFYAMEYIEGESLDKVLARRSRLPWEEVVRIGEQLCEALQHAHDKGIIHRDLKPSNIMMLPDGSVKLTDFGIAKDLDVTELTATNCTVGTASYMSPEQCRGERHLTSKSDLYSMGVMFYELITGRKPFEAESAMEMFLQHVKGSFVRPSKFVLDIPIWLDNLICQLLEKQPDERPMSARMVAETLGQIRDKVEAQQSAGMERATSRGGERKKERRKLDETDKDAVRALLGKKKKKKKIPFYQQGWFTVLALLVVLGALSYGAYLVFFTSRSLESLHEEAVQLAKSKNFENWMKARKGPLQEYIDNYQGSDDPLAGKMDQLLDEVKCNICIHQMHNRRNRMKADKKGEVLARQALDEEELGKLSDALATWKSLAEQKGNADDEKHNWGLVGERQRQEINRLTKKWSKLFDDVKADTLQEMKGKSAEEKLAIEAIRLQQADETEKAKKAWSDLSESTEDEFDVREWHLLAAYQVRVLEEVQSTKTKKNDK